MPDEPAPPASAEPLTPTDAAAPAGTPAPAAAPPSSSSSRARLARWAPGWATTAALALAGFYPVGNSDTFGHLAIARYMVEHRTIPRTDPFSFFRGGPQPWLNYEWLSELALWAAYSLGGVNGLLALRLAILALIGALVASRAADGARAAPALAARGESAAPSAHDDDDDARAAGWVCAALVLLALPASRARLTERPHIFGLALAALYLSALPRLAAGRYARPALAYAGLALAHAAWVNLHGSHLFGLTLTGAHLFACLTARDAKGARALGLVLGLQCLATCATPFGPRIVLDAIELLSHNEYRTILTEWAPLSLATPGFVWAAFATGALCLAATALPLWRSGAGARGGLFVSALLMVMALRSQRFVVDFLVLSAPVVAAPLWRALASRAGGARARAVLPYGLAGAALAACLALMARHADEPFGAGLARSGLPFGSGRWIAEHVPAARVLGDVDDAWYVEFAAPRARVLIDGRVQLYGAEFAARVLGAMQNAQGLAGIGASYPIDALVTRHTEEQGRRATNAALALPEWALVYVEDEHALFLRAVTPERAAQLEQVRLRALPPGYFADPLLDPAADPRAALDELRRIADRRDGVRYRSWAAALIDLRPLARDAGRAGFAHAETPEMRAVAARSARRLRSVGLPSPAVGALRAAVEASACELDAARASLALLRARGVESREALFAGLELALREGRLDEVRAFVEAARAQGGEAARDPWVAALEASLRAPPRCP